MERPFPCFVDGKTETSIAFAQDAWCSDECHKRLAWLLGFDQWDLTSNEFESAMRRLAKQEDNSFEFSIFKVSDITEEIKRGRNGVEVYGSKALLIEAERPGNWRDAGLPDAFEGWSLPKV